LLRVRVPGEKMGPDECAHIMRGVWRNKIGKATDNNQNMLLWGFAQDMMTEYPTIDPKAVLAHAIDRWDWTQPT
jgi:hypothetical protein